MRPQLLPSLLLATTTTITTTNAIILPPTTPEYQLILPSTQTIPAKPLPLLIWHGLGDRYDAEGLHSVGELAQKVHPGTYVHYIRTADDGSSDRTASFFGNVTVQINEVCEALLLDPRLRGSGPGFGAMGEQGDGEGSGEPQATLRVDALGFSQGGQFLRGLIERCPALSVRSLVTFGSQHNGIQRFQECDKWDFVCGGANALLRGNVWSDTVQNRVVPAQYFRDLNDTTGLASDDYLSHSHFLADINNENPASRKMEYKSRLTRLQKFVMYVFEADTTVIPKESGWFADVNLTSGVITPLRERTMYIEDWIGLKEMDEQGKLVFRNVSGRHMALDQEVLISTFTEFFGAEDGETMVVGEEREGILRQDCLMSWFGRVGKVAWSDWVDGLLVSLGWRSVPRLTRMGPDGRSGNSGVRERRRRFGRLNKPGL